MTFRPKDLATVPTDTPDVEIFFYGQLFLRSDGATCEVAVNQLATNHVLTVEARTRVAGQPVDVKMRHVGPLNFRQREGMLIEVLNSNNTPAAWNCRTFGPINYASAEGPPGDDFRWILNLEGPLFHGKTLNPPIFNSHHVIRLQGGEYFFRTARRTSGRFDMLRKREGEDDATFKKIGAVARASVFLTGNQSVTLSWQGPVTEREHTVTLPKQLNTTHEIYINNAPLFLGEVSDNEDLTQFDELIEYYKLIRQSEVAPHDRFRLVPAKPDTPTGLEGGSPDIPCQVMRLDGMTEN